MDGVPEFRSDILGKMPYMTQMFKYRGCRIDSFASGVVSVDCAAVIRVVLVLYLCLLRKLVFVVEQPGSSCMSDHPRVQEFLRAHFLWRKNLNLISFGLGTKKPTQCYPKFVFRVAKMLEKLRC